MALKYYSDEDHPFHMNLAILYRLDRLLNASVDGFIELDYNKTYMMLKAIFREISFKLTPDEFKEVNEHIKILQPIVINYIRDQSNSIKPKNIGLLANKLENFDITMRRLMQAHGFLLGKGQDPAKAVFR